MNNLTLLCTCIIIAFTGCEKYPERDYVNDKLIFNGNLSIFNVKDDSSIGNINGTWKVISYEDNKNNSVTIKSDVQPSTGHVLLTGDVILTFDNDSLYGISTMNRVTGNYYISGRNFHIIRIGGTKIGESKWGYMFYDVVHKLDSFAVNDTHLRLYYNESNNSVTFIHN